MQAHAKAPWAAPLEQSLTAPRLPSRNHVETEGATVQPGRSQARAPSLCGPQFLPAEGNPHDLTKRGRAGSAGERGEGGEAGRGLSVFLVCPIPSAADHLR